MKARVFACGQGSFDCDRGLSFVVSLLWLWSLLPASLSSLGAIGDGAVLGLKCSLPLKRFYLFVHVVLFSPVLISSLLRAFIMG
ncbi:hypothetical protein Bca4012_020486 [Brassica carinata]